MSCLQFFLTITDDVFVQLLSPKDPQSFEIVNKCDRSIVIGGLDIVEHPPLGEQRRKRVIHKGYSKRKPSGVAKKRKCRSTRSAPASKSSIVSSYIQETFLFPYEPSLQPDLHKS